MRFGLHIYQNNKDQIEFKHISNLYTPKTIYSCFEHTGQGPIPGIKDDNNKWNIHGHAKRIVTVTEKELALFAKLYDEEGTPPLQARLPALHSQNLIDVLHKFADFPQRLGDLKDKFYSTVMWDETNCGEARWQNN